MQGPRRGQTYGVIAGVVVGMLIAGLLVPLVFGDTASRSHASSTDFAESTSKGSGAEAASGDNSTDTSTTLLGTAGAGATAGGASVGGGPTSGTGGTVPSGVQLTASDKGITPTTVKLGFVLLDLTTANAAGLAPPNYTPDTERKIFQAFVDDLNKRGGLIGRQVQVFYATSDPFAPDSTQAACLQLTKDVGVFAVVALPGFALDGPGCIAKQNNTPLILLSGQQPRDFVEGLGGLVVLDQPVIERSFFQLVGELDNLGLVKGHKFGVVATEGTTGGTQGGDASMAAVKQMGGEAVYRTRLSEDLQTGASQVPLEVQKMRAAGADSVILHANFIYNTQFAQQADSQGWHPKYYLSDQGGMTADDLVKNMPQSFDGALAWTMFRFREPQEGKPEQPLDRACRDTYNRSSGENRPYGETNPINYSCGGLRLFSTILELAGPNPTRQSWKDAAQRVSGFQFPFMFGGSFGRGRFDWASIGRMLKWSYGCKCYKTSGDPHPARF